MMVKITINGVEFEVAEEVATEMVRLQEALTALKESSEGEGENSEAMDKLQATIDSLTLSKGKLQTQLDNSNTVVDEAVIAKVALLKVADDAGVVCKVSDSALVIKQAIVKSFDMDTEGKTEVYLDACIDMKKADIKDAADRKQKALDSINKVGDEFKPNETLDADKIGNQEIT